MRKKLDNAKVWLGNHAKSLVGACSVGASTALMTVYALASESSVVGSTDIKPVIDEVTSQVSVANIATVLAAFIGICIGLVFFWWALRKVLKMIMSAFRRGKASV